MDLYRQRRAIKDGLTPEQRPLDEIQKEVDVVEFSSMSELASVSYEARAKGVKNGMFLGPARKLCPDIVTIPYDFEGYQEVARTLYDTVAR